VCSAQRGILLFVVVVVALLLLLLLLLLCCCCFVVVAVAVVVALLEPRGSNHGQLLFVISKKRTTRDPSLLEHDNITNLCLGGNSIKDGSRFGISVEFLLSRILIVMDEWIRVSRKSNEIQNDANLFSFWKCPNNKK